MTKLPKIDLTKYEKPSLRIKFKQGDNKIRVVTEPYMYQVVGKRTANGYIQHILQEGVEIPDFLKDGKPKLQYGFVVFSHDTGHFHIIETGTMLGHPLTELIKQKYPEEYKAHDIIVHRIGEKLKTEYTVKYADKSEKLPEGVSKNSPEYKFVLSYFEGLQ
jgi:hypothetical protein